MAVDLLFDRTLSADTVVALIKLDDISPDINTLDKKDASYLIFNESLLIVVAFISVVDTFVG